MRLSRTTWIAAAMLVGFGALAACVAWVPANRLDLRLSLELQRATALGATFRAVSVLGHQPIDIALPFAAVLSFIALAWWLDAACLAASVGGSALLDHGIKLVMTRARPTAPVRIEDVVTGSGFPSGHVMQYVALFGFLALVARARLRPPVLRDGVTALLIALVVLVGPSRVYLGAHWTTDVVGGYLLAGAWLVIVGRYYVARI